MTRLPRTVCWWQQGDMCLGRKLLSHRLLMEKYLHRRIYLCLILHLFRGLFRLKMLNIIQNAHNILNIKCQVYIYLYRCYCVCTVQYWRVYAVHCHLRPVRAEGSYHNKVFTMILYLPPIPHLAVTGAHWSCVNSNTS